MFSQFHALLKKMEVSGTDEKTEDLHPLNLQNPGSEVLSQSPVSPCTSAIN